MSERACTGTLGLGFCVSGQTIQTCRFQASTIYVGEACVSGQTIQPCCFHASTTSVRLSYHGHSSSSPFHASVSGDGGANKDAAFEGVGPMGTPLMRFELLPSQPGGAWLPRRFARGIDPPNKSTSANETVEPVWRQSRATNSNLQHTCNAEYVSVL